MDIPIVGDLILDTGQNGFGNSLCLILEVTKTEKFIYDTHRVFRIRALELKTNVLFEVEKTPMMMLFGWRLVQRVG